MKFKLVLLFLVLAVSAQAQIRILGAVRDSVSKYALGNVHIVIEGEETGSVSNDNGIFILKPKSLPVNVKVSHVAYHTRTIKVSSKDDLRNVLLAPKNYTLPVFSVGGERPRNIIKNSKLYVLDYDFKGDSIVMLAYKDRKDSRKQIVLLTDEGDTLKSRKLNKMDALYKDCFDNHHLLTEAYAYQLHVHDEQIDLIHQIERDSLLQTFNTVIEKSGPYFYIRATESCNQIVHFYIYDTQDSSLTLWRTIADEGGLERLGDKARLQSAQGYTAADARFEEMAFYAPKFVPLVKFSDSILIFNHVEGNIEVYSNDGELLEEIEISYHENRRWKEELFVDEATDKLYTLYKVGGISYLKQIDAASGAIVKSIKVPEFLHIEKIKVHNDKLYFLYKDTDEFDYKQLYCMNI
jgi:hypothetical protein